MTSNGVTLMGIYGEVLFSFSVLVFLLSMFLFIPFTKYSRPTTQWTVARIIVCLLVLLWIPALDISPMFLIQHTSWSRETIAMMYIFMTNAMTVIAVAAVYVVLAIDRIAIRRKRKLASIDDGQSSTD